MYFPRELHLLFLYTGFAVETAYGDYTGRKPRPASRTLVLVGQKTDA